MVLTCYSLEHIRIDLFLPEHPPSVLRYISLESFKRLLYIPESFFFLRSKQEITFFYMVNILPGLLFLNPNGFYFSQGGKGRDLLDMTVFRFFKNKPFLQKCLIFKRLGTESSRNPAKLYSSPSEVLISVAVLLMPRLCWRGVLVFSGNICQHKSFGLLRCPSSLYPCCHLHFTSLLLETGVAVLL